MRWGDPRLFVSGRARSYVSNKPKVYISNAFSLNMIDDEDKKGIGVFRATPEQIRDLIKETEYESSVGHESTADVLSKILDVPIKAERKPIKIGDNDILVVFQLKERLPEGKVLSEDEVKDLVEKGKAEFDVVTRLSVTCVTETCYIHPSENVEKTLRNVGIDTDVFTVDLF